MAQKSQLNNLTLSTKTSNQNQLAAKKNYTVKLKTLT